MILFPVYLCLPLVYLMVNRHKSLKTNELQRFVYLFTCFSGNGPKKKTPRGQKLPRARGFMKEFFGPGRGKQGKQGKQQ